MKHYFASVAYQADCSVILASSKIFFLREWYDEEAGPLFWPNFGVPNLLGQCCDGFGCLLSSMLQQLCRYIVQTCGHIHEAEVPNLRGKACGKFTSEVVTHSFLKARPMKKEIRARSKVTSLR